MKQLQRKEAHIRKEVEFEAYGRPLEMVMAFKYLGRVLTESDDDCPELVANMRKAWR